MDAWLGWRDSHFSPSLSDEDEDVESGDEELDFLSRGVGAKQSGHLMSPVPREHWEHLRETMLCLPVGNRRTQDLVEPLHRVHGMNRAPPHPPQIFFRSTTYFLVRSMGVLASGSGLMLLVPNNSSGSPGETREGRMCLRIPVSFIASISSMDCVVRVYCGDANRLVIVMISRVIILLPLNLGETHPKENTIDKDAGYLNVMQCESVLQLTAEWFIQEQIPLLESNEILIQDCPTLVFVGKRQRRTQRMWWSVFRGHGRVHEVMLRALTLSPALCLTCLNVSQISPERDSRYRSRKTICPSHWPFFLDGEICFTFEHSVSRARKDRERGK